MFETAVADGSQKLGLQQKVAEAGRVDAGVAALLVDMVVGDSELALLAVSGGGGLVGVELLIGVVDEIVLGRHDD